MTLNREKPARVFSTLGYLFFALLPLPFIKLGNSLTGAVFIGIALCIYYIAKRRYYIDNYMLIVTFLFVGGELLSLFRCTEFSRTISSSIQKLIIILVIYSLMRRLLRSSQSIFAAGSVYKYASLTLAVIALISIIFHINVPFVTTNYRTLRLVIAGHGPNVIARLFCIGAFFALYDAQVAAQIKEKARYYIQYIIFVLAVAATVSLFGILLLAIGTFLIYISFNRGVRKIGIIKLLIAIGIVVLAIVIAYYKIEYVHNIIDQFIIREEAIRLSDSQNGGFSLHGRTGGLRNYGANAIKYYVVGVGYSCSNNINGQTIHFPILASLLETGVLGLASCLILYGYPIKCACMIWGNKSFRIFGIVSLTIFLGDMVQPNPNYVFTWFGIFLSICAYHSVKGWQLTEESSK